jgi:hypothetical protein
MSLLCRRHQGRVSAGVDADTGAFGHFADRLPDRGLFVVVVTQQRMELSILMTPHIVHD